jgi:hypothetical protein
MILTSMEILILRVEPRWLEAYSQILISNLQQALKNQLMAVGLKAIKCLHLIFVQLKDVSLYKRGTDLNLKMIRNLQLIRKLASS